LETEDWWSLFAHGWVRCHIGDRLALLGWSGIIHHKNFNTTICKNGIWGMKCGITCCDCWDWLADLAIGGFSAQMYLLVIIENGNDSNISDKLLWWFEWIIGGCLVIEFSCVCISRYWHRVVFIVKSLLLSSHINNITLYNKKLKDVIQNLFTIDECVSNNNSGDSEMGNFNYHQSSRVVLRIGGSCRAATLL